MKTNKKNIIIPALMMAVGLGLVGSISGTVAWYQYSTRVTTSYIGASAKCTESLQISLTGEDNAYVSELKTADIKAAATENCNGEAFQPVTSAAAHATAVVSGAQSYAYKGHPMYQNFEYSTWQDAPVNSYLQYDLYFRVLDVDGAEAGQEAYIAKKLYFEDFVINFTGNAGASETAFKDALRFQFDQINGSASSILLSNTARSSMKLGGKLDLNGDGNFDKTHAYEWQDATETVYGDESLVQTTAAIADYKGTLTNGKLVAGSNELGTTVAAASGAYAKASALHFKVTMWLEGWDATGTTAATSIWDAIDYIGSFQIGMTFGITPYGEE